MNRGRLFRRSLVFVVALMLVSGAVLSGARMERAGAVVGAYVELHVAECPPGYEGDTIYEDCHENRVPGVTFIAEGAGDERYEQVTDETGVAFFNDFYTAGPLEIIEKVPSGDYYAFELYCTTVDGQISLPVAYTSNGRAAGSFDLSQDVIDAGGGVVCDWYYFAPGESLPPSEEDELATEAPAFGLGLTRTQWEEIHGPGNPADGLLIYESGRYVVGLSTGHVTFIETGWEADGGIALVDARDEIAELLPGDAELVERYELPTTPGGPVALLIERYESETLASFLSGQPMLWDGSAIAVYQLAEDPDDSDGEPLVMLVNVAAGSAVTGP